MNQKKAQTAYSYIRFSSYKQAEGDSLRRQIDLSRKYAETNGLVFNEDLRLRDLGVSGFRGRNSTAGALSAFLIGVEERKISKDSYLIVEHLDRLSRQEVDLALELFLTLIRHGITIVTLIDGMVYNQERIRQNPTSLVYSVLTMITAHGESALKSERVKAAAEKRRGILETKKFTAMCPFWLTLDKKNNKFIKIPERVSVIKYIFSQAKKGIGAYRIAKELDMKGEPVWHRSEKKRPVARKWHQSYIIRILTSDAVRGRFTPHKMNANSKRVIAGDPIENYFPRIISESDFARVRKCAALNRVHPGIRGSGRPGRIGQFVRNLFPYLLFDYETGIPVIYVNKDPYFYIRPDKSGTGLKSIPYRKFESICLRMIGDDLVEAFNDTKTTSPAEEQIEATHLNLTEINQKIEKLVSVLEEKPSPAISARLFQLEEQKSQLEREIQSLTILVEQENELRNSKNQISTEIEELIYLNSPEARLSLRNHIRRLVKRVDVLFPLSEPTKERSKIVKKLNAVLGPVAPLELPFLAKKIKKLSTITEEEYNRMLEKQDKKMGRALTLQDFDDQIPDHSRVFIQITFINGKKSLGRMNI